MGANLDFTTGQVTNWGACPQCGKPRYYVGDPITNGQAKITLCQCPDSRQKWQEFVEQSLQERAEVWRRLADIDDGRGARCLGCGCTVSEGETHCCHDSGLEISVGHFRVKCAKCGKETERYTVAPYGSRYDGTPICAECIDK